MDWKKYVEDLNRYVRPNSFPIGINVVKRLSDLPPGARKRRFKINVCQIGAFARFYGWTIYGEAQDMDCVLGACTCGLISTPERVTKGVLGDKVYQKDLKAAAAMQKALPKLDPVYKAVVCYPLGAVDDGYDPDVIMVYVDSAQCGGTLPGRPAVRDVSGSRDRLLLAPQPGRGNDRGPARDS